MKVKAYGKVNLALDILGVRPDHKHNMNMINARVDLADELDIEAVDSDHDEIHCPGFHMPVPNTLTRTLDLLREHGLKHHYHIDLVKNIPSQAGLGGGSADAAALILALNEMEGLGLSLSEMEEIGFQIGADVPCCLHEDFTHVTGAGENVEDLNVHWQIPVVLVQGVKGISTVQAFAYFDEREPRDLDVEIVGDAVRKHDIGLLYQTMTNAFEPQAFEQLIELQELKEAMQDAGLVRVMMTGSGSCLMGFSVDDEVLDEAVEELSEHYPFVFKGLIGR